jgi:flagellar FliL protein
MEASMAETAPEGVAEEEAPPKKSKKGLVVVLLMVLLPAGTAGATYVMMAGKIKHAAEAAVSPSPSIGTVVPLESFVVNLNEPGKTRYLKLTIDVELGAKLTEEEGKKLLPRFRDQVLIYLTGLREADVFGPIAKQTIKKRLLEEANKAFGKGGVKSVFYRELVMQ